MNEKEADAIARIAMYCEKIKRAQEKLAEFCIHLQETDEVLYNNPF